MSRRKRKKRKSVPKTRKAAAPYPEIDKSDQVQWSFPVAELSERKQQAEKAKQSFPKELEVEMGLPRHLLRTFVDYLSDREEDLLELLHVPVFYKYVKISASKAEETIKSLKTELKTKVVPVPYIPNMFRVPVDYELSKSQVYQEGAARGMDVSKGIIVHHALDVHPGQDVLMLECQSGNMAVEIAEIVGGDGSCTCVSIERIQANMTSAILKKYGAKRSRVFLLSGTVEAFVYLSPEECSQRMMSARKYGPAERRVLDFSSFSPKEAVMEPRSFEGSGRYSENVYDGTMRKLHRWDLSGLVFATDHTLATTSWGAYDRVLVYPTTSTSGALRYHIARGKYEKPLRDAAVARLAAKNIDGLEPIDLSVFATEQTLKSACEVAAADLLHGFRMVAPGGIVTYCTSSALPRENEAVITRFLEQMEGYSNCDFPVMIPLDNPNGSLPYRPSEMYPNAVYIDAKQTGGDIMFVCRFRRVPYITMDIKQKFRARLEPGDEFIFAQLMGEKCFDWPPSGDVFIQVHILSYDPTDNTVIVINDVVFKENYSSSLEPDSAEFKKLWGAIQEEHGVKMPLKSLELEFS